MRFERLHELGRVTCWAVREILKRAAVMWKPRRTRERKGILGGTHDWFLETGERGGQEDQTSVEGGSCQMVCDPIG